MVVAKFAEQPGGLISSIVPTNSPLKNVSNLSESESQSRDIRGVLPE